MDYSGISWVFAGNTSNYIPQCVHMHPHLQVVCSSSDVSSNYIIKINALNDHKYYDTTVCS